MGARTEDPGKGSELRSQAMKGQKTIQNSSAERRRCYASPTSTPMTASLSWLTAGSFALSLGGNNRYSATPIGLFASRRVYSTTVLFFPRQRMIPMVAASCGVLIRLSTAA